MRMLDNNVKETLVETNLDDIIITTFLKWEHGDFVFLYVCCLNLRDDSSMTSAIFWPLLTPPSPPKG